MLFRSSLVHPYGLQGTQLLEVYYSRILVRVLNTLCKFHFHLGNISHKAGAIFIIYAFFITEGWTHTDGAGPRVNLSSLLDCV